MIASPGLETIREPTRRTKKKTRRGCLPLNHHLPTRAKRALDPETSSRGGFSRRRSSSPNLHVSFNHPRRPSTPCPCFLTRALRIFLSRARPPRALLELLQDPFNEPSRISDDCLPPHTRVGVQRRTSPTLFCSPRLSSRSLFGIAISSEQLRRHFLLISLTF